MPELPEVESIRRTLEPHLVGRRVVLATLLRRDVLIVRGDPAGGFSRSRGGRRARPRPTTPADLLEGATVSRLVRRGKQMAIVAECGRALVVQLGMSGQLFVESGTEPAGPHVHARWVVAPPPVTEGWINEQRVLLFRDPRRFGALRAFSCPADLETHWGGLGPDALGIAGDALAAALKGSRAPIKAALLDQSVLAGVGNIYVDEALFEAGVHPLLAAGRLGAEQRDRLAAAVRGVLARAVAAGGSTVRDYADGEGRRGTAQEGHRVYGRGGEPCVACGGKLAQITAAQRTTVFCPRCQRRTGARKSP